MEAKKFLVVVCTKNEAATIRELLIDLVDSGFDVLVVDDSTDDWQTLGAVMKYATWVLRGNGDGFAAALRKGLWWGLEHSDNYSHVIVMDVGGTHSTGTAKILRSAAGSDADLVIASRFHRGSRWLGYRTLVSLAAAWMVRTLLDVKVSDATTGFRCYRINSTLSRAVSWSWAKGFAVQIELLVNTVRWGGKVIEIPAEYRLTNSTFSWKMVVEGVKTVWSLRRRRS